MTRQPERDRLRRREEMARRTGGEERVARGTRAAARPSAKAEGAASAPDPPALAPARLGYEGEVTRLAARVLALAAALVALFAAPASAQLPLPGVSPFPGAPPPQQPPGQPHDQPAPPPSADPDQRRQGYTRLSNERTLTRHALAVERARVRREPAGDAKVITRLRYDTEDGYPEVYLVLRRFVDARGAEWLEVRLPMRPNGRRGWVRRAALGKLRSVNTQLEIDRRRLRATLRRDGRRIWSAPVGIGKRGTPTPAGRFWIRERIGPLEPGSIYGTFAFGTAAYSSLSDWPGGGVVGIHGTNQPGLIPGRPSHGCVRLRNGAIDRLQKLMPIGTPVRIR